MKINGITINEKKFTKDMLNTLECWRWLARPENDQKEKKHWPKYAKIKKLKGECAFCEFFCKYITVKYIRGDCFKCIRCNLFLRNICYGETDYGKIFWQWQEYKEFNPDFLKKTRHELAGEIANAIEDCLKEWGII